MSQNIRILRGAVLLCSLLVMLWTGLWLSNRLAEPGSRSSRTSNEILPVLGPNLANKHPAPPRGPAEAVESAIELPEGHRKMLGLLNQLKDRAPDHHPFYGRGRAKFMQERLDQLDPAAATRDRISAIWDLATAELFYDPTPRRAIEHLLQANDLLPQLTASDPAMAKHVKLLLGTAYLRLGEAENCCLSTNSESCILPIQGGGVHARTEGSRQAIKHYLECLQHTSQKDEDLVPHLTAIWLLNVASMTLNEYPNHVPEQYRIPPEFFQSRVAFPRFENVMPRLELDTVKHAGGVIVDDFDNDDYLDIFICSAGPTMPTRFFRNNQDGTFVERTREAGLTGFYGGLNMVQADYNNDGNLDVYIMRGAWMADHGRHPDSLLRNNGNATFTDVTFDAGLGEVFNPNKTAAWGDYDNDGDLDLFVGNESRFDSRLAQGVLPVQAKSQMFRNNGDETFTDMAEEAGVAVEIFAMGSVWGDYDQDRFPDLFISADESLLFHNNQDGTFSNATGCLPRRPKLPFPTWFWDFDNDGSLDLYISSTAGTIDRLALRGLGQETPSDREGVIRLYPKGGNPAGPFVEYEIPALCRGDGRGGFADVALEQGLTFPTQPMGANFGDLNGDGYLDFYLATGNVPYWDLWPNVMYLNQGGMGFVDVTMAGGFGHLQKGHGVSFADIDNDGDQDVYNQIGGQLPGDKFSDALYENPGFGHHWITVKLVGERSNKSAIGARIHVTILEDGKPRSIYRHVNSGGSFGCNPLRQNIGLGNAGKIVSIEIYWPTTDLTQTFHDVALDQSIEIHEGDDRVRIMEHVRSCKLGGP